MYATYLNGNSGNDNSALAGHELVIMPAALPVVLDDVVNDLQKIQESMAVPAVSCIDDVRVPGNSMLYDEENHKVEIDMTHSGILHELSNRLGVRSDKINSYKYKVNKFTEKDFEEVKKAKHQR